MMKTKNAITLYLFLCSSIALAQPDALCSNCIPKTDTIDGRTVSIVVDEWPEYPGGMLALTKFLSKHLK
jgi:hypothetical protein